jgi:hypothetical protein
METEVPVFSIRKRFGPGGMNLPPRPRAASVRASSARATGPASTVASVVATSVRCAVEAAPCRHAGDRSGASSMPHGKVRLVRVVVAAVGGSVPGSVPRAGSEATTGIRRRGAGTGSRGLA